jgi:RNA polymerase sigma factor (sigma-70 family)
MQTDQILLARYTSTNDQQAFKELVDRHLPLVYATATRQLRGPGNGEDDVAQAVFLLLSQKAKTISPTALTTWLYRVTTYSCQNQRKSSSIRNRHEKEAAMRAQSAIAPSPSVAAEHQELRMVLDEALARLGEKERGAILVCYLQSRTAAETGESLGISAEAVEKRLERGIEKLRHFFAQKGFVIPAASAVALMTAEAAIAAPPALATTIATVTTTASVPAIGIANGVAAMMKITAAKLTAIIAASVILLLAAGTLIVLQRRASEKPATIGGTAATSPATVLPAAKPPAPAPPSAAQTATTFFELIRTKKDAEAFAICSDKLKNDQPFAKFAKDCEAIRTEADLSSMHTLAVMEEEPAATADGLNALAITNLLPKRPAGRSDIALGISMVRSNGHWRIIDIDMIAPGKRRDDYFNENFKGFRPTARYVDPISPTPELLAQRFVETMAAGQPEQALALYATPREAAQVFEGDVEQLFGEPNHARVKMQLASLEESLKGATYTAFARNGPGPRESVEPGVLPKGNRFGPLTLIAHLPAFDNSHVSLKLQDGTPAEIKLDELFQFQGSWRLLEMPQLLPKRQPPPG